jgi:hypothetical protein
MEFPDLRKDRRRGFRPLSGAQNEHNRLDYQRRKSNPRDRSRLFARVDVTAIGDSDLSNTVTFRCFKLIISAETRHGQCSGPAT